MSRNLNFMGMSIEITSNMLFRKVILGNVYRLPRETSTDHINLLDIKTKDKVLTFYNSFTTIGYLPEITLPTRFSHRIGTLIDNFL